MNNITTHIANSFTGTLFGTVFRPFALVAFLAAGLLSVHGHETSDSEELKKPTVKITTETSSDETTDWGYDEKGSRSRVGMSNMKRPGKTTVIKSTTEISQVIDVKQRNTEKLCESDIDLEYYQKDTQTEVRTLFSSTNCDQFDAVYQLQIMYFDSNGEIQRIVADEEWPVGRDEQMRKTYAMEPESELRRVTSRILSCTCRSDQQ